jgi:predicted metal-dependent phosphoesterase TrpH
MIDLHCHSNLSDGHLSPSALLKRALIAGVRMLALTDHDTIDGLMSLQQASRHEPILIINGIELSTRWKKYDIHVIGLGIDLTDSGLTTLIHQQTTSRIERAHQIAAKMALLGIPNAFEKARTIAGHQRIGRPHFASVLMAEKNITDRQLAFKRYLGRGKPAYVPTLWVSIAHAVAAICAAGGQAILAHPLKYNLTKTKLHELITEFKSAGGAGLEVISGEMTTVQIQEMAGLCLRFNLLSSTGSDYHGDEVSRVSLGRQRQLPENCTPIWQQWTNLPAAIRLNNN